MPIDWSKYGVGGDIGTSNRPSSRTNTSVDFSKYMPDQSMIATPEHASENEQYANMMKQAYQNNPSSFSPNLPEATPDQSLENAQYADLMKQAYQSNPDSFNVGNQRSLYANDESRKLPVIGPVFRALDAFGTNPTVEKAADIGRSFLIPGASAANLGSFAGAAEAGLSKLAPGLAASTAGKFASDLVAPGIAAGAGGELYNNPNASGSDLALGALEGGAMGAGFGALGKAAGAGIGALADRYAGTKIGDALGRLTGRSSQIAPESEQATNDALNTYNQQYKNPIGPQTADDIQSQIMQEVSQRVTPPLENPKLLDNYLFQHLGEDIPKSEISGLSYNDKADLAQHVRDNLSTHDVASQVAKEKGYDWNDLIGGKSTEPVVSTSEMPKSTFKIGDDVIPTAADGTHLSEPQRIVDVQSKDGVNYYRMDGSKTYMPENQVISASEIPKSESPTMPNKTTVKPSQPTVESMKERGHTATVRTSDTTPEPLKQVFSEPELYKTRSTQKLFDDAQKFVEQHGQQGAYDFVMGAKKMTDKHNAVAQILSKQLANSGDISRAIDVVSKTAQHGTELGRAIQALSLWNRMDTEGALLLAQRQINKNAVKGDYRTLTPEQAQPVIAATEKIQQAQQTKNLADEVLNIVSNKPAGEKLSDAEIATIKEFQKQVTDINGKVKDFLPDSPKQTRKTIEEVNKIPPAERTTDQLRDYWDARAERARKKLAAQRNIGLLPDTENPVLLYAELGVAKIAKGALNLVDFTDQMTREFGDKVRPVINQVYNHSLNMFRKSQGLPTTNELNQVVNRFVKDRELDAETAAEFKNWANKIAFYTDDNLRTEAVQDLQLALRKLDKSTLGQKISSLQASAQLLSIPTTVRNVIGNEAFNVLEKANKLAAVPIDWSISKFTKERSIVFNAQNQEKYWSNWFEGAKGGWRGVSPNGKLTSYDIRPEVFGERNPLKYLTKLTGAELQSFDHAAYMRSYGDVLATYAEQLGKSQGLKGNALKEAIPSLIKQMDQSIFDMADEAGKYATFQDDTALSKAAEAIKKGLNYPTKLAGDALVKAGVLPESWNPSGFGVGDIVLKYAKTPANIIMRAIDYSPIGIGRGILQMAPLLTGREFNQRQAVLALSRGITGTLGLTGLGYYLASQGILTGAPSGDKDVKALQDAAGQKGYQVNISALKRWITSGLDKNAAKYQNGDNLINYDWLQPMAISLAMGVNANEAANSTKAGFTKTGIDIARDAIVGGLKTVMQQPLVQGLQQLGDATSNLMKNGSWSGFANIMKGIPASFVPAISGQVRNFTDNTSRSTYDPNTLKSMVNMVMNRIPGLSQKLPPQIESLGGTPKTVVDGGQPNTVGQAFNVFLNPAKTSQYNVTPEAAMVLQLINDTGDNRVAPRVPNRYLMVNKQKVDLTPGQYVELQQNTGQFTAQQLQRMSPMLTNPNVPDNKKVDAVINVLNTAGQRARSQLERNNPELRPKKAR